MNNMWSFELTKHIMLIVNECSDIMVGLDLNIGYSKFTGNFQIILQIGGLAIGLIIGPNEDFE